MASAQRVWLWIGILLATFVGCLVTQSFFQDAETQSRRDGSGPSFPSSGGAEFAPDRILVKLKEGVPDRALDALNRQNNARVDKRIPRTRVDVVELPRDLPVQAAVRRYEASPNVEYAEPDFILRPSQTVSPNDPYYPELYGLNNTGQFSGTVDADIDAPEGWSSTTGSKDTVVAVIDTGVDINHPDLKNNLWTNSKETPGNGIDDDLNGYVDDVNGWDFYHNDSTVYDSSDGDDHGTHVAGTIAAEGNNDTGVSGVSWKAKIMVLKFLGPDGGYTSDAAEALNYAVAEGATISNNSWGGGGYSLTLLSAINKADLTGHLFAAAAGNGGSDGVGDDNDSTPFYPASYDSANIISVAATDHTDTLTSFSNYGATSVDLAAPGRWIYSTLPGNTYGYYSGTSMATPHVSGTAALLKSKNPSADDTTLKAQILESVDKKSSLQGKTATGGRLNAARALGLQPTALSLTASPTAVTYNGKTTLSSTLKDSSGNTVTDKTVSVWRSANGATSWSQDGYATYDSTSKTYRATRSLTANTYFQLRFSGENPYMASTSPIRHVYARAYLSQPSAPSTVKRNTYFSVSGYLAPYHSGYTRLYFFRYDWGKRQYVYYTSLWAPNAKYSSYTKYVRNYIRLPYGGYWYVRAHHHDSNHASTWSPIEYFRVS